MEAVVGNWGEECRARRKETLELSTGRGLELQEEVTPVLVGPEEDPKAPGWRSAGTDLEVAGLGRSTCGWDRLGEGGGARV